LHQRPPLACGDFGPAERRSLTVVDSLASLRAEIGACRICRESPSARLLPHEPRPVVLPSATARILVAGQAPGTKVHATGLPFNDASGDRLRDWLGVSRDEFYDPDKFAIVPMGFCFPGQDAKGGDLPPRRECAPAWRTRLLALMPQIELVLAIGLYAQSWHLGAVGRASLTQTVMDWREIHDAASAPKVLPLPHPSWRNSGWIRKNPWFETELLPFLRMEIRGRLS
jgi:uracil-DNA glycosylase